MMFMPMFSPTVSSQSGITMVAVELELGPGFFVIGYNSGAPAPDFGSISAEPLIGETLIGLIYIPGQDQTQLFYEGEIAASLSLLTLYVDDVAFSLSDAFNDEGRTLITWWADQGPIPIFEDGHSYNIRIE